MSRDPASVMHELDYWQALLEDLRSINQSVLDASAPISSVAIELLPLLFRPGGEPVIERVTELARQAQDAIAAMQTPLEQMIRLAEGRLLALRAEGFTGQAADAVTLTSEQAESICETLVAMAVRLPLKYRDHAEALLLLRPRAEGGER